MMISSILIRNISCMEFPSWPAMPTSVEHCRYSPPPPEVCTDLAVVVIVAMIVLMVMEVMMVVMMMMILRNVFAPSAVHKIVPWDLGLPGPRAGRQFKHGH